MNISLSYPEITDYLNNRFHISPCISYVDEKTVNVSYKPARLVPTITVNLHVETVSNDTVTLSYDGSSGTKLLIQGVVVFLGEKLNNNIVEIVTEKQSVVIHLNSIAQLQKVFEYVTLNDVNFNAEGANVLLQLIH